MNEDTVQRPVDNEPLDLGTEFSIDLWGASVSQTDYTIDELSAALEMTTMLTDLVIVFSDYWPKPEHNRLIIEPLCRCIANLRRRNNHHPLRALTLRYSDLRYRAGMLDVFEQFLIAATKYGGIFQVQFLDVQYLPIKVLVEFCHNNNNLKVMKAQLVSFSDGSAAMSVPPYRTQDSSVMLAVDELSLPIISFDNSTASTTFANFIARMTVRALVLGEVWAIADDADDLQMTKRILSQIKMPSVEQLELDINCQIEHFKAALEAGTTSLIELDVHISYDEGDYMERLELLTNLIRRAVQLNSLTIHTNFWRNQPITLPRELLRAIEACATVWRFRVLDIHDEDACSRDEMQQLQRITARNEELGRFVASPSTDFTENLLGLMRQFENCPTGRYMLARNLPVVLSFEQSKSTNSSTTEPKPNPKKRKVS